MCQASVLKKFGLYTDEIEAVKTAAEEYLMIVNIILQFFCRELQVGSRKNLSIYM